MRRGARQPRAAAFRSANYAADTRMPGAVRARSTRPGDVDNAKKIGTSVTIECGSRQRGQNMENDDPVTRPLKAYAFDPSAGKLLGNEMTMQVRYQQLQPGPVVRDSARDAIAVVDYDGANRTYYAPVDLDDKSILIRGGLDPDEADPRFHQQMVY